MGCMEGRKPYSGSFIPTASLSTLGITSVKSAAPLSTSGTSGKTSTTSASAPKSTSAAAAASGTTSATSLADRGKEIIVYGKIYVSSLKHHNCMVFKSNLAQRTECS